MQKEYNKKHQEKYNKKYNKNFNKKNIAIAQILCLSLFSLTLGFCSDNNSTNDNPRDTSTVNDPNKQNDTLSFAGVTNNAVMQVLGAPNFIQLATATSQRTGITYTSSEMDIAIVDSSSGEVMIVAVGTTMITATLVADEAYNVATATYTLTIIDSNKQNDTLSFAGVMNNAVMKTLGVDASSFTQVATATSQRTEIAYSSDTPGVATVNSSSGEVTIQAAGSTTITATLMTDATYNVATASYTLTVAKQNDTLNFADVTNNAIIVSLTDPSFTQVATATSTRTGITYTSSEMNIATVNPNSGEVTILAPGITIITATLEADETYNEATASYTLTVNDPNKQNDTLSFADVMNNAVMQTFGVGDSNFTQVATATSQRTEIIYSSSETDVATVDSSSGEVTIQAAGTSMITATLAADATFNASTASYTLTVIKRDDTLSFADVMNNAVMQTFGVGDSNFTQVATATSQRTEIAYSSDTPGVATVNSSSGEVSIVGAGSTTITATLMADATYNVATVSYTLTVAKGDDTLNFADVMNNAVMQVVGASNFVQAATATSQRTGITYTSSEVDIATVSSSGEVMIVAVGTTMITATLAADATYNIATASYTLTVIKRDDTLTFAGVTNNAVMQTFGVGDSSFTHTATATSQRTAITYTSNTPGVATVDSSSGEVTIQAAGSTTITATLMTDTNYNEATESYTLTVVKGTETLTFASTFTRQIGNPDLFLSGNGSVSVLDGSNLSFARIASSPNATGTITYTLSPDADTGVATVDSATGVVTIVATGKTTITATRASDANYNAASASYTLIVAEPVESFSDLDRMSLNGHYALTANIELSEDAWRPIGYDAENKFTGSLNGRNFKISNLNISSGYTSAGLFGYINNASISNLGVVVAGNISSFPTIGALVGVAENSSISNSYVEITGNISNSNYAGGLVGDASDSLISNSYVEITGNISNSNYAGGLVGDASDSLISNSYAVITGNISSPYLAAGLIGFVQNSPISHSYAVVNGNISATSSSFDAYAGGLVGDARDSLISNSYADVRGSISAHVTSPGISDEANDAISGYAAGLIGRANNSPTSNSYTKITGNISASSMPVQGRQAGSTAAGLVGLAIDSSTSNSYAAVNGNISSMTAHSSAAGLIGRAFDASPVRNSYAIVMGTIAGSSHYTGGLVGYIDNSSRSPINNSYYNASPSGGNSFGTSQTLVQLQALTLTIRATDWTGFYDADSTPAAHALITDTTATFAAGDRYLWYFGDSAQLPILNPSPKYVTDADLALHRARQNFIANTINATQINLSWSDAGDTYTKYEVYRHDSNDRSGATKVNTVSVGRTYMDTTGLTTGTSYYYWLKACNASDECSDFFAHTQATTK